jgi:hypothetical protein
VGSHGPFARVPPNGGSKGWGSLDLFRCHARVELGQCRVGSVRDRQSSVLVVLAAKDGGRSFQPFFNGFQSLRGRASSSVPYWTHTGPDNSGRTVFGAPKPRRICSWVPKGSLAGVFLSREMTLRFVWGICFWCSRHCKTSPVDLGVFGGRVWTSAENRPNKLRPDCVQVPTWRCSAMFSMFVSF